MTQRLCLQALVLLLLFNFASTVTASDPLELSLRYRKETSNDSGYFHTLHRSESWQPEQTALIICDMWDAHHCLNAVRREKEFAPRLQQVIQKLRDAGVTVIHAPSSCMDAYKDSPARKRAIDAPASDSVPSKIGEWCHQIPEELGGEYPIDQSDGGEDDDPDEHAAWAKELADKGLNPRAPWKRQIDVLTIDQKQDFISDSGVEIWNVLASRKIKNVILAGVHTNMCVLGRPFGLRQMAQNGKNVVLMRDLTDTMYNPKAKPFVSHFTGTDLIVEHIEKFVCPTITSDQVLGGSAFRFSKDRRPHIAIVVAEREYDTQQSLAKFAAEHLGKQYKTSFVYADAEDKNYFPGLDILDEADAIFVSVRRRTLKPQQLDRVHRFIASGKPVIGIRTASHAFSLRKGEPEEGYSQWKEFDAMVFGGSYTNHYGNDLETRISFAPITHSITNDMQRKGFASGGSLYKVAPLARGTTILMYGEVKGAPREPVAWTFIRPSNKSATGGNARQLSGRSFYTSLGHTSDFANPSFNQLLKGGIVWAVGAELRK